MVKKYAKIKRLLPAIALACAVPAGSVGIPYASVLEVSAAAMTQTDQIVSITENVEFAKPLTEQGFEEIFTSQETALKFGDIILTEKYHYAYLKQGAVLDLDTRQESTYSFQSGDHFYRWQKVAPEYTIPQGLVGTYHDPLEKIILPDGFQWQETGVLNDVGQVTVAAVYTPENALKYQTVRDIPVPVTVSKRTTSVSVPDNRYTISYKPGLKLSDIKLPSGWSFAEPGSELSVGEGSYKAVFAGDTEHYEYDISEKDVTVSVEKGYLPHPSLSYIRVSAGTLLTDSLLPEFPGGKYKWENPEIVKKSGNYSVTLYPDDTNLYKEETGLRIQVYVSSVIHGESENSSGGQGNQGGSGQNSKPSKPSKPSSSTSGGENGDSGSTTSSSETRTPASPKPIKPTPVTQSESGTTEISARNSGSYLSAKTLIATNKGIDDVVLKKTEGAVTVNKMVRPNQTEEDEEESKLDYELLKDPDGNEYYHIFDGYQGSYYFTHDQEKGVFASCNPDGTQISDAASVIEIPEDELKEKLSESEKQPIDDTISLPVEPEDTEEDPAEEEPVDSEKLDEEETEEAEEKSGPSMAVPGIIAAIVAAGGGFLVYKKRKTSEEDS